LNRLGGVTDSRVAAIVISSLLFGAWHFINSGSIVTVIVTATIGAILAIFKTYVKNCSIVSVAIAHGFYDGSLAFLSWLLL
jgi:membrane protease YdiL (CAAX protease family)